MTLYASPFTTPLGEMLAIVEEAGALVALSFCHEVAPEEAARSYLAAGETLVWERERCEPIILQLNAYFCGERQDFDLPVAMRGTPFQKQVWSALLDVPYGTTISYRQLAERIGNPAASRAVGRANATNPIAIIVPCHRVVGSNGTLTGYAGGLAMKANLLALEQGGPEWMLVGTARK